MMVTCALARNHWDGAAEANEDELGKDFVGISANLNVSLVWRFANNIAPARLHVGVHCLRVCSFEFWG